MAIMQCPQCHRQFGLSATTCDDCDLDLVEVLAGDVSADPDQAPTIGDLIDQRTVPSVGSRAVDADPDLVDQDDPIDQDDLDDQDDPDHDRGDDAPAAGDDDPAGGDDDGEHVTYEMGEWSAEARVMLEQLLAGSGIARVWEGTDLVVRAGDEEAVDDLVEQVRSTDQPMLDPDAEKVVYEVADWTTEQVVSLTDTLGDHGVGYQFDMQGDLVVLATDEDQVDSLLDALVGPGADQDGADRDEDDDASDDDDDDDDGQADGGDESVEDPDDGLVTAEILSDLFVACDRLQHNARDADGVLGVVGSAERLAGRALPFGYEPRVWDSLVAAADGLRDDLAGDEATDDELEDKARALRDRLRDYV